MSFDISEFTARNEAGFSRDSFFLMQMIPPAFYQGDTQFLSYLCSATQLPGVSIQAQAQNRWGYGPQKKVPYGLVHSDINLTVYSDASGSAIDFFNQWQNSIIAYGSTNSQNQSTGAYFGEVSYPDQYETTIQILYFSETGDELIRYTMTDAYPLGMGDIPVSWSNSGNIASLVVPITYRTYQIQRFDVSGGLIGGSFGGTINNAMDALFNAEAITSGFIDIGGASISFSAALQALTTPLADIGSKLNIVGGINASISSIANISF